mgnify:CR=1 FL=1
MRKDPTSTVEGFVALLEFLKQDPPADTVVSSLVNGFLSPYRVQRASLHLLVPPENKIHTIGSFGLPDPVSYRFSILDPEMNLPVSYVLRTNRLLHVSPEELFSRFPALQADFGGDPVLQDATRQIAFLPISVAECPIAVFGFAGSNFDSTRHSDLVAIQGLTAALSLWLGRVRDRLIAQLTSSGTTSAIALTARQRAILDLLTQGQTNGEMAAALGCSRSTVKYDLQRIMFAVGVRSRGEVLHRAAKLGLMPPPR